MADVDFSDRESAERWFEEQSVETRCLITSRAALRMMAPVGLSDAEHKETLALTALRATLTSMGRGLGRPADVKDLERAAFAAARSAADSALSVAGSVAGSAIRSAILSADSAARSAAGSAARSAILSAARSTAGSAARSALSFDADHDSSVLRSIRVWAGADLPKAIAENHARFLAYLESHSDWQFWRRWYGQMWEGTFTDWGLAIEVAKIPDEVWEQGLGAVAEAIREIEARRALGPEIRALRESEARFASESFLPSRGHNNPPELIAEPQLVSRVEVVWAALDTLEQESEAYTPDVSKASKALLIVRDWFIAACKYLGRKADLAIDTAIKWAIPVAAGGYLAIQSGKVQKIVELAETWLKL